MLKSGLLIVALTFSVVVLVLIGQFVDANVRPIPGLFYLFAACDPPAVLGGWLAALGAMRAPRGGPGAAGRSVLVIAALALTTVAIVVLGDFAGSRVMKGSAIATVLGSKPAWLVADVATVVALGSLALGCDKTLRAAGRGSPGTTTIVLAVLLSVRLLAGVWGAIATVPSGFRLAEAALYAAIAWSCARVVALPSPCERRTE